MIIQQKLPVWAYLRPSARRVKRVLERISQPVFKLRGSKHNQFGYFYAKQAAIEKALLNGVDTDSLPVAYGISIDERVVEYPWLLSRLPDRPGKLLDAGSALNHDFVLSHARLAKKELFISTLAPESDASWRSGVSYVYEDFRHSCFRDDFFDWIACISTLEHVGLDNTLLYTVDATKQEAFSGDAHLALAELKRMLAPGGTLFLTFPFGKAQNFGWFQVFDSAGVDALRHSFAPQTARERYFLYDKGGWRTCEKNDAANATYHDPQTTKGLSEDGAAGARGLVCLEWTK
jgi:SAM-dependent methyltransferase